MAGQSVVATTRECDLDGEGVPFDDVDDAP